LTFQSFALLWFLGSLDGSKLAQNQQNIYQAGF
jgi:hypothetical protein